VRVVSIIISELIVVEELIKDQEFQNSGKKGENFRVLSWQWGKKTV
jgi:hypothetical protein